MFLKQIVLILSFVNEHSVEATLTGNDVNKTNT